MRLSVASPEALRAIEAVDAANALDPNVISFSGNEYPLALLQGQRASLWLERLDPAASDAARIAARAHHLRRWTVNRSAYPEGRVGYHRWKKAAKDVHAVALAEITVGTGLGDAVLLRSQMLVRRIGLGTDPETQVVEDCACLVFLETQFETLIDKIGRDPVVDAVRKTLKKMSPAAIQLAGDAVGSELARSVLGQAVQEQAVQEQPVPEERRNFDDARR